LTFDDLVRRGFKPMEPVPRQVPFDSPDHLYQVKWDGVRMVAFVRGGFVRLQNRRLRDRTSQYPELSLLPSLLRVEEAILDGEVVVIRDQRPSFSGIIRRDSATDPRSVSLLQRRLPATYMVFDLLWFEGRDITAAPLTERISVLGGVLEVHEPVLLVDSFDSGLTLFEAVKARGWEGIVAKTRAGPYLPGRRSDHWVKIKVTRRGEFVIGGVSLSGARITSLKLGAYDEAGRLVYVGSAGSGLSWDMANSLKEELTPVNESPFINPVGLESGHWVQPERTVLVRFFEWTEDLKLRGPVIEGLGNRDLAECLLP